MTCVTRAAACSLATLGITLAGAAAPGGVAAAAEPVKLTLKDHHFAPAEVTVPAGERFRIEVTNQDHDAGEFESTT